MKVRRISVLPHAREPAGSYALIKLIGITELDRPVQFRLDPPDGQQSETDWPSGPHKPFRIRTGANSVDLIIGPEVVKANALAPGTPVRFRIPRSGIDMDIVWPDLSAAAQSTAAEAAPTIAADSSPIDGTPVAPDPRRPEPVKPISGPIESELAASVSRPATPTSSEASSVEAPSAGLSRLQRRPRPSLTHAPNTTSAPTSAPIAPFAGVVLAPQTPRAIVKATPVPDSATEPSKPIIDPKAVSAYTGFRERAEAARIAEEQARRERRSSYLPLAAGLLVVVMLFAVFLRTTRIDGTGVTLLTAITSPADPAVVRPDRLPSALLHRILQVGTVSPQGRDASQIKNPDALERVNQLLAKAQTTDDRNEAAFWLRRALSRNLSEPRLVWAVTQLGTAYASTEGNNRPDYEAARLLWGWAADAGDGQAACFLARLYEHGLGTGADRKRALQEYERAGRLGGCPGLEQALLRVKK